MKNTAIAFISCMVLLMSCKKNEPAETPLEIDKSALILGTFTRTKVEASKNGSEWKDFTSSSKPVTLTFEDDGIFTGNPFGYLVTSNWEIQLNGNVVTIVWANYFIDRLDEHTLVLTESMLPPGDQAADGQYYKHWRYTYKR